MPSMGGMEEGVPRNSGCAVVSSRMAVWASISCRTRGAIFLPTQELGADQRGLLVNGVQVFQTQSGGGHHHPAVVVDEGGEAEVAVMFLDGAGEFLYRNGPPGDEAREDGVVDEADVERVGALVVDAFHRDVHVGLVQFGGGAGVEGFPMARVQFVVGVHPQKGFGGVEALPYKVLVDQFVVVLKVVGFVFAIGGVHDA